MNPRVTYLLLIVLFAVSVTAQTETAPGENKAGDRYGTTGDPGCFRASDGCGFFGESGIPPANTVRVLYGGVATGDTGDSGKHNTVAGSHVSHCPGASYGQNPVTSAITDDSRTLGRSLLLHYIGRLNI